MILKNIRNLRIGFHIAIILITILIGPATVIALPNVAYSQFIPSVSNNNIINTANNNNKAVILTLDDAYKSQYTNAKPI